MKVIAIVGPTASGKTELAIKLAKKFNGEIVNSDSRLIYKDLKIGINKPRRDRTTKPGYFVEKVEHHLIDFLSPRKRFSVANYQKLAKNKIREIYKRNRTPFLVGGSPLYADSVIYDYKMSRVRPDEKIRKKLEKRTVKQLASYIKRYYPDAGNKLDFNNKIRLIRAIEVLKSNNKIECTKKKVNKSILIIGVRKEREKIYKDIDKRVDQMIRKGLISEVKKVLKKYGKNSPALFGIGYRQVVLHLHGKISKVECRNLIKRDTRRFVKRQMTWYRKDKSIMWIKNYREANKLVREFIKN